MPVKKAVKRVLDEMVVAAMDIANKTPLMNIVGTLSGNET